jgi:hypothetical protein
MGCGVEIWGFYLVERSPLVNGRAVSSSITLGVMSKTEV